MDHLIEQLKVRFGEDADVPKQVRLQELMPVAMNATSLPRIMEAAELFEFDLNRSLLQVKAEQGSDMDERHPVTPRRTSTKGHPRSP